MRHLSVKGGRTSLTTLYLTPRAWRQIEQAVRKQPMIETGGILMGYQTEDGNSIIAYASGPGPKAIQTKNAVQFDDPYLKRLAQQIKRQSAGRLSYIGDWHSHTVKRLTPSRNDRLTVYQKSSSNLYTSSSPLMLIVGLGKRDQLQARAFVLSDSFREVKRIQLYQKQAKQ